MFKAAFRVFVTSHLKCIRLVSVRSSLPCINTGVRIELTLNIFSTLGDFSVTDNFSFKKSDTQV